MPVDPPEPFCKQARYTHIPEEPTGQGRMSYCQDCSTYWLTSLSVMRSLFFPYRYPLQVPLQILAAVLLHR